jgi:hypothetical protein
VAPHRSDAASEDIAPRPRPRQRGEVSREARFARLMFLAGPFVAAFLFVSPRLVLNSTTVKLKIADELAQRVTQRTGASIDQMGGVSFGWAYDPCLQASEVYRTRGPYRLSAKTQTACIDQWPSAVGSGFRAIRVVLEGPRFQIIGGQSVVAEKKKKKKKTGQIKSSSAKRKDLREIKIVFDDLRLDWDQLPLPARISTGSFGPIDGSVTVQKRGSQSAASIQITEPITGLQMRGRAIPSEAGWDLTGRVEGDLAASFGPIFAAAGLDVRRLPTRGQIGVFYAEKVGRVTIDVDLNQSNVDIASKLVSSSRLSGFRARQKVRINIDLERNKLWIEKGLLEINGIPVTFSMELLFDQESPRFLGDVELPTVPMTQLLKSIPGATLPAELSELSSAALFALKFSLSGVLNDPANWKLALDHRLAGLGKDGQGNGLAYLSRPFTYYPLTKTGRSESGFQTGPMTSDWISYKDISYAQRRLIQVSEDASFFVHKGIDLDAIKMAVVSKLTSESQLRGGSTLTQQLVKNLLLTRDRTAMRKVQEVFLTFLLESSLSKEAIFELYVNLIEWGPTIYGLNSAAYYYFGREPKNLSLRQMAYLTSIIPGPLLFHKYYETNSIPVKHHKRINLMLRRLRRLKTIKTDEELQSALHETIVFRRDTALLPVKPTP